LSAGDTFQNPATIADYLAILRRRLWLIVALPIITGGIAYLVSVQQSPLYKASAQVSFKSSPVNLLTDTPSPTVDDPTFLPTQAATAREVALAERVVGDPAAPPVTPGEFIGESSATTQNDINSLELAVTDARPEVATALANIYANTFKKYKAELDTAAIRKQIQIDQRTIERLRAHGNDSAADDLLIKMVELQTQGNLLAKNARVSQLATGATKIRPQPKRNALLGALLGGVLGVALALLAEALDRRVRSEKEIEEILGLPLLGRLSRPSRRLRKNRQLVMMREPTSVQAETFRKLRTSLEFVNFDRGARTIMVTSAGPREGKSTTVANLAVAFARAGRRVALIDLDLRRPVLEGFFGGATYGITDVVVGHVALEDALRPIVVTGPTRGTLNGHNGNNSPDVAGGLNGSAKADGVLHFLPCGTIPPAADEFLESPRVEAVLKEVAADYDVVLVDAPPLLAVGDPQTLSAIVDGMIVVSQLGAHRRQLQELARQLPNYRADVLGFVLTGVTHSDSYSYGYGYDPHVYEARSKTSRRGQRV
jgi:Mrp family chromosome partitioning ATPase/capsular polysaccharide biosynthesis protein